MHAHTLKIKYVGSSCHMSRGNLGKKEGERNAVRACVFQWFCVFFTIFGHEVCSETAGAASHVPASKTQELMLRVVKQLVLHHMFQATNT